MPKRVLDGEALWTSDKLAQVKREFQSEYSYLLPLAAGNGTFECDARLIWRTAYSYGRPHITPEIVREILNEFERVKMLFRWQGADGKTYGYWIGIDKEGRLPPPSRTKHERQGPSVPRERLATFLQGPGGNQTASITVQDVKPVVSQCVANGFIGMGMGMGMGIGIGTGIGSGLGSENGVSDAAGGACVAFVSSLSSEQAPLETAKDTRGAGAEPRVNEEPQRGGTEEEWGSGEKEPESLNLTGNELERENPFAGAHSFSDGIPSMETEPTPVGFIDGNTTQQKEKFPVEPKRNYAAETEEKTPGVPSASTHFSPGTIAYDFGPSVKKSARVEEPAPVLAEKMGHPAGSRQSKRSSVSWLPEAHPLRITDENFDALDFAFTRMEDFGGLTPKELRRTVYYHWRAAQKKYWSTPKARIESIARLEQMLSKMYEQVPEKFHLPGSTTSQVPVPDPHCAKCSGVGSVVMDHPAYPPACTRSREPVIALWCILRHGG